MRPIKFRCFFYDGKDYLTGRMITALEAFNENYIEFTEDGELIPTDDCAIMMQFIGLKDKDGEDIYEGDILRIKGNMGDTDEYKYDCLYRVNNMNFGGLYLSFVRLFSELPDSHVNSYPINTSPSFEYRSLCVDYVNSNYNRLAIPEKYEENRSLSRSWKQYSYTNDIEKVGNIYENTELVKSESFSNT